MKSVSYFTRKIHSFNVKDTKYDQILGICIVEPSEWNATVKKVMKIDNSWNNTAGKYIEVYNAIRE